MTTAAAYAKKLAAIAKTIVAESDVPFEPSEFATPAPKSSRKPTVATTPKAKALAKKSREGASSARKLTALARAGEAVRLKRDGHTFHEIAQQLGITRQAAHQLVTKYREEARE